MSPRPASNPQSVLAIIGDGQMGLLMANILAGKGCRVRLWGHDASDIGRLSPSRQSERLPGFTLHGQVELTADDAAIFEGDCGLVVNAVPTQFIRGVWRRIGEGFNGRAPIVSVSKGIENDTLLRPTQIIAEILRHAPGRAAVPMCVLSGPTIGSELARSLPATMVAASESQSLAKDIQSLFCTDWLRIYTNDDPLGVELAGATKNVIAIAAGMVDGLGVGCNAKSALLARGLAEIARLGVAMGARLDTFFGVAGVGDLATTCFSSEGRNRSCGESLGRGVPLQTVIDSSSSVIEGVATTRSVKSLAQRHNVDMPITAAVHAILFEGLHPHSAIRELMIRERKPERVG
jgi:glycerol-3-phosphate dehydrogenase (NAD(P)+)